MMSSAGVTSPSDRGDSAIMALRLMPLQIAKKYTLARILALQKLDDSLTTH